jgi:phosphatidylserine synthase
VTLGAWALIGFDGMARYPQMLSEMSLLQEGRAQSLVNVLVVAGISPSAATSAAIVAALAVLCGAWRLARRPDGDRRAFGLTIIAALTGTPIVWEHYMVLLFVPIALVSPRLSRLWLAPVLTPILIVLSPLLIHATHRVTADSPDALRATLPWLAAEAIVAIAVATTPEQRAAWARALHRRPGARAAAPAPGR